MSIITDNKVLVHIYSGLESKNKITLGLLHKAAKLQTKLDENSKN